MKRILRHVGVKDFRKTYQKKLDEQRVLYLERREKEIQEQQYLDEIERLSSPFKSDWRSEIDSDKMDEINERMTTSALLSTTLPETGETTIGTESEITLSGVTGVPGFFGLASRLYIVPYNVDTLVFTVTAGVGILELWTTNDIYGPFGSGTHTVTLKRSDRTYAWAVSNGQAVSGFGIWNISSIGYQRRRPMNVLVSLDSPEATNFIRTDPIMQGLSAQERRKKLEDMLDAGDEYLLKQLGMQGSKARPADTGNVQSWEQAASAKQKQQQVSNNFATSKATSDKSGYMDIQVGDQRITRSYEVAQQKYQQDLAAYEKYAADFKQESERLSKAVDAARAEYLKRGQSYSQIMASYAKLQAAIKASTDHGIREIRNQNKPRKPTPPTPPVSQPQPKFTSKQLADIDKQIKDLQAQSEKNKRDAANNMNMARLNAVVGGAAGGAALGLLGGAAITAGLGGAALRAGSQIVKTGAGSPGARAFAKANPGKYNPFLSNKVNRYLRNSHEPQGQVISEKKLNSPKEVLKDKIPGYYDGKPAPLGFPETPPPEMVNGMHPDLVDGKKVADRFNRLDPQSAQAMPLTGNPHIDKKVLKARKQPK